DGPQGIVCSISACLSIAKEWQGDCCVRTSRWSVSRARIPEHSARQRSELYADDKMRRASGSDPVGWILCAPPSCPSEHPWPDRGTAASGCVLASNDGFNAGAANVRGGGRSL